MQVADLIRAALAEDLIDGKDLTSDLLLAGDHLVVARLEARETCVLSGVKIAAEVFAVVDPTLTVMIHAGDGTEIHCAQVVMHVRGRVQSVLRAERTALNFLSHLSGVATHTRKFVTALGGHRTKILATRKTIPGLRELEIAAVRHAGGDVYRTNLSESLLVKDNHLAVLGGIEGLRRRLDTLRLRDAGAVERMLRTGKVEVGSLQELDEAVEMGWRQVLLDNFSPVQVRAAVSKHGGNTFLEISGGVNLGNLSEYASTGASAISVGAITHSSRAADFSLEIERSLP